MLTSECVFSCNFLNVIFNHDIVSCKSCNLLCELSCFTIELFQFGSWSSTVNNNR